MCHHVGATWMGSRYRLMLLVVTRKLAEHKTRESAWKKERSTVSGHCMQNHCLWRRVGVLALASLLLSLKLVPKQVTFIQNQLSKMEWLLSLQFNWLVDRTVSTESDHKTIWFCVICCFICSHLSQTVGGKPEFLGEAQMDETRAFSCLSTVLSMSCIDVKGRLFSYE